MRVLVTGGTGFLGSCLVRRLLLEGHSVRVLTRSSTSVKAIVSQGAEAIVGEITDRDVVRLAVREVELIYHLAGQLFAPEAPVAEYRRAHVEGTSVLLACCRELPSLNRFVHASTTGVLGVTGDRPVTEDAPFAPTNAYELTKSVAESLVREAGRTGLPAVIVRPGLVYGPGDLHLLSFFRAIQRGLFRPIGAGPVYLHPVYVDDLAEAFLSCGVHPRAIGECFHVAGPRIVTLSALAGIIAHSLGVSSPRGTIPLPVGRAVALLGDLLPTALKPWAPLTGSRLDFLTHSRVYDVEKVGQTLGFRPATDLDQGMAQTVAWYRRQGYLPPVRGSDSVTPTAATPVNL